MKKIIGSVLVASALLVTNVQAKDRSFGEIYKECGLGGMIGSAVDGQAGDILAIVTNVIWDLGTTAISSDVTSDDTCANSTVMTAALINQGYDKLESEIAMGDGEYLNALVKVSHKSEATIRKNFAVVASSDTYNSMSKYEKAEKLFNITTK